MDAKSLNAGGWVAIILVVLVFVSLALSLLAKDWPALPALLLTAPLTLAQLYLSVFLLSTWKRVLGETFGFNEADSILDTMKLLVVVLCVLNMFGVAAKGIHIIAVVIAVLTVGFAIAALVARLIFARKLLRLPDDLSGLRQTYCFLLMAECICWLSIILFPVGLLVSVATSVTNAMIFFRTANRIEAQDSRTEGA